MKETWAGSPCHNRQGRTELMRTDRSEGFSRRQFLVASAAIGAAGWLAPGRLWAAEKGEGVVQMMRGGAADAKLTVEAVGKNLHVILGSGGNIAVLSGP